MKVLPSSEVSKIQPVGWVWPVEPYCLAHSAVCGFQAGPCWPQPYMLQALCRDHLVQAAHSMEAGASACCIRHPGPVWETYCMQHLHRTSPTYWIWGQPVQAHRFTLCVRDRMQVQSSRSSACSVYSRLAPHIMCSAGPRLAFHTAYFVQGQGWHMLHTVHKARASIHAASTMQGSLRHMLHSVTHTRLALHIGSAIWDQYVGLIWLTDQLHDPHPACGSG